MARVCLVPVKYWAGVYSTMLAQHWTAWLDCDGAISWDRDQCKSSRIKRESRNQQWWIFTGPVGFRVWSDNRRRGFWQGFSGRWLLNKCHLFDRMRRPPPVYIAVSRFDEVIFGDIWWYGVIGWRLLCKTKRQKMPFGFAQQLTAKHVNRQISI